MKYGLLTAGMRSWQSGALAAMAMPSYMSTAMSVERSVGLHLQRLGTTSSRERCPWCVP